MMMLKRDPLRPMKYVVEPPLYGNYVSKYRPGRNNYNLVRDKLQNTPRSDRTSARSGNQDHFWQTMIPPGTDACPEKSTLSSTEAKRRVQRSSFKEDDGSIQEHSGWTHRSLHQALKKNASKAKQLTMHSFSTPLLPYSATITPKKLGRKYYNVMWEPRVARGPTIVDFGMAQRAKCLSEWDLKSSKRRPKKWDGGRGSNFSGKHGVYPDVKIKKIPLSYEAFTEFLTESVEVSREDRAQTMRHDGVDKKNVLDDETPLISKSVQSYLSGPSKEVQTEMETCHEDTNGWIAFEMKEKIPMQALLEVMEEDELEIFRGERRRYETALLFSKRQKDKEDQWNEHLMASKTKEFEEIQEEENKLEDLMPVMGVLAFSKNAVNCCVSQATKEMKQGGFFSKTDDASFDQLQEMENVLSFEAEAQESYVGKSLVARRIVDSVIVQATINRSKS